ncbi:ABC transporter ATP-binding protein [candidate division WOR-3 bacterium]|nr:ABC transporter ATP-binding protein [candidate division WOR-3 bacterium]MCK4528051.1 ABC transporter ATP-binding protein [candidate division WOR-3 bacterium]
MMHGDAHSYFEEDKIGKVYDSTIMRWLWHYIKLYRKIVVLNFLLVLLLTGFNLTLPFIYKIGIDRYITPTGKEVFKVGEMPEEFDRNTIIRSDDNLFIDLAGIKERVKGKLEDTRVISKKDYYLVKKFEGMEQIINNIEYVETADLYIVATKEMSQLSLSERIQLRKGDLAGIKKLALIYLILIFLIFILTYIQVYQIHWIGQKISYTIREELIKKYTSLAYNFFQKNPVGRLVTRVSNDVKALSEFFSEVLVYLGSHSLTIIGILGIMLFMSPRLFLVTLAIIPLLAYLTLAFRIKARTIYRNMRKKLSIINSDISESISGIPVIQSFVQEDRKEKEFSEINNDYYESTFEMIKMFAIFRPMISLIRSVGIALLIWYGGKGIISGIVSFGTFVAFISYLERLFHPIRHLSEQFNIMQSAMAAGERVYHILQNDERIPDPEIPFYPEMKGKIEFENVWFSYDGKEWTLKDISFKIEPGEKVGIMGYTGSGKTTIVKLLLRLYDIDRGSIKLDGVDIRKVEKKYLRRHIATVSQEPFLFSGNLRKNVNLWREPDEEMLNRALRVSNLTKAMDRKNISLDLAVTEEGGGLSVGEKQLVTFARSLIDDTPILVLDEATANIDPETEWLIQEALFKMIKGKTSLIIAHRLATLKKIDSLIVVHKGKIVQRGTHRELIKEDGIYRTLYKLQEIA